VFGKVHGRQVHEEDDPESDETGSNRGTPTKTDGLPEISRLAMNNCDRESGSSRKETDRTPWTVLHPDDSRQIAQIVKKMIYLDNAATSFPKPESVMRRMVETYLCLGVSPGRGSYDLAWEAQGVVWRTRQKIASFFGASDPERVIFTNNASDALNIAIQGMVRPGDHVVSTHLEHNSVLRPLNHLHFKGVVEYDLVYPDKRGYVHPEDVARAITPATRLVVVTHASNVIGTVQPIAEIGRICKEKGVPLLVDAAQTAGVIEINMKAWHVAALAFTGHKSMLGPTGIGGLVLARDADIEQTRWGGTGIESKSRFHTPAFPHRLEVGTHNLLGIIGLSESIPFLEEQSIGRIREREMTLLERLRDGLSGIEGVTVYCADDLSNHVALLTANIEGLDPEDVGDTLNHDYCIAVRTGLHCAPGVHETIPTTPRGSVRFSLGLFTTEAHVDRAIEAMAIIAGSRKTGREKGA
jgi:cysteine desulfurase / selenocysteine lyase